MGTVTSFIFDQMEVVRNSTLKALEDVPEQLAAAIPAGFRNSILWHAGHIFVVQERFAFYAQGLEGKLPPSFQEMFGNGSTPLNWSGTAPSLAEVKELLRDQTQRILQQWKGRTQEGNPKPLTLSNGYTLTSTETFLNYSMYHEGMHTQAIKMYKTLLSQ